MKTSARQMVDWITASIRILAVNPNYGTLDAVFKELAALSGLSKSAIMKLHSGESKNPTVDTVDKLVAAIKQAMMKLAA